MIRTNGASGHENAFPSELHRELTPASSMNFETSPPPEASRDSNLEIGRLLPVKEFVLYSMTADFEQKTKSLPDKLRDKGLRLAAQFQRNFIHLITDRAQNIAISGSQISYLRTAIIGAVSFEFRQATGEVRMDQNAADLLIAATYINSLGITER